MLKPTSHILNFLVVKVIQLTSPLLFTGHRWAMADLEESSVTVAVGDDGYLTMGMSVVYH